MCTHSADSCCLLLLVVTERGASPSLGPSADMSLMLSGPLDDLAFSRQPISPYIIGGSFGVLIFCPSVAGSLFLLLLGLEGDCPSGEGVLPFLYQALSCLYPSLVLSAQDWSVQSRGRGTEGPSGPLFCALSLCPSSVWPLAICYTFYLFSPSNGMGMFSPEAMLQVRHDHCASSN